jgi:phosphoserine phosphatase
VDPRLDIQDQLPALKFARRGAFAMGTVPLELSQKAVDLCRKAFAQGISIGWQPYHPIKAVFFDMDATVIAEESLVELSAYAGQIEAVSRITERAMAGELDFKSALIERVALIKGLTLDDVQKVLSHITLNTGIREFVKSCTEYNIPTFMVSGGFTQFASYVQGLVGFADTRTNVLEVEDGRLTGRVIGDIVDAQGKKAFLLEKCAILGIKPEETCAVGDGANDLPMLQTAGLAVGFKPKKVLLDHIHVFNGVGDHRMLELFLG